MEEDAAAAAAGSSSLPPEPEPEPAAPPSPRGQKRGARPDDDEAAGDGAARGSPRRAAVAEEEKEECTMTMDSVEEEEEEEEEELDEPEDGGAPAARQLFDFFFHHHAHPDAAAAAGSSSTAGREPVDVTLRLGVGHPADDGSDGAVDTTLRLSSAAPALREYCGRLLQFHAKPAVVVGAAPGAASNAETGPDDGQLGFACGAAAGFTHVPPAAAAASEDDGFLTIDGFAAGDAAGRPSSGSDLNKRSPSACPDGPPDPYSHVPAPAPVVDDNLAAGVAERPAAAVVEQRHRPTAPFIDFFCSPVQGARAPPGVLTADSS